MKIINSSVNAQLPGGKVIAKPRARGHNAIHRLILRCSFILRTLPLKSN